MAVSLQRYEEWRAVELLVQELADFKAPNEQDDYSWGKPALNVLDCILSLNRKYDSFVVPRVEDFLERHPEVESLEDLAVMINKHGVTEFLLRKLNYNDPSRARTLFGVVEWLIELQHKYEGETENDRLEAWAVQSKAEEFEKFQVKGFGLAGFQYLRMLFGAQTAKPDVHIKRFVAKTIGKKVTDWEALQFLELAAKKANFPIREVDWKIWEGSAGNTRGHELE